MVTSVYHRLRVDIERGAAALERSALTPWFMAFTSGKPLSLHHPQIGAINYATDCLSFWGSPSHVFDSFARLSIDDLIEAHIRTMEHALECIPEAQFDQVIDECVGLLTSANLTLSAKAAGIKGRLLRERGGAARPHPIPHARETPKSLTHRLKAKVDEVRLSRSASATNIINVGHNHGAIQQGVSNASQAVTVEINPATRDE